MPATACICSRHGIYSHPPGSTHLAPGGLGARGSECLDEARKFKLAGTQVLTCGIAGLKGERVDEEVEEYRVASRSPAPIRGYYCYDTIAL